MRKILISCVLFIQVGCFAQPDIECYSQAKLDSIIQIYQDSIYQLSVEKNNIINTYTDSIILLNDTIEGLRFVNEVLRNDTATSSVVLDSLTYQVAFSGQSNIIDATSSEKLIRLELLNDSINIFIRKEDEMIPFMNFNILNIFNFID